MQREVRNFLVFSLPFRGRRREARLGLDPSVAGTAQAAEKAVWLMRQLFFAVLQVCAFWLLNAAGVLAAVKMDVPVPGNLIGMALLYALLALGIVKLSWFETAGSFLIKHLAFFFVPITVGLMDTGALFAARGVGIAVTLAISAAAGLIMAGWVSQRLLRKATQWGGAQ
jgi:holin-like protein